MTFSVYSAKTKSRNIRLLVLACICAIVISSRVFAGSLTLERPDVDVNWNRIPAPATAAAPSQAAPVEIKFGPNRLFGTVEIRSKIKNLPQWERILRAHANKTNVIESALKSSGRARELQTWNTIRAAAPKPPTLETLRTVNAFFNQWPYRTDMEVYGVPDYWATPAEFISKSGDCEDYSITKMYALLDLGHPADQMRLVILKDTIRNLDHAVLAVYLNDNVYILDNMTNQVNTHERYRYYMPQLSMDSVFRWAHLPAKK